MVVGRIAKVIGYIVPLLWSSPCLEALWSYSDLPKQICPFGVINHGINLTCNTISIKIEKYMNKSNKNYFLVVKISKYIVI